MGRSLAMVVAVGTCMLGAAGCGVGGGSHTVTKTVAQAAAKVTSAPTATATRTRSTSTRTITVAPTTTVAPPTPTADDAGSCDGHACIGDPAQDAAEGGTVVQCADGAWSHAGGLSGACSDHGGEAGGGAVATTQAPAPSAPSSDLHNCDANVLANADTSCGFASNTFYEYWLATGGSPTSETSVQVFSPATGVTYTQVCTEDGEAIDCTHHNGDETRFSQASIEAYTQSEADAYAARADLGG